MAVAAWSETPFGNDDARDFLFDLEHASDAEARIRLALSAALDADDYLEAAEGAIAVAAAAVLVIACGGAIDGEEKDLNAGINALGLSSEACVELSAPAAKALDRVGADDSELLELWDETDDAQAFRRSLIGLRIALSALP
jgi:hypothetical protein